MDVPSPLRRPSGGLLRSTWVTLAVLGGLAAGPAQAASFGHARLASQAGEPLVIMVPVTQLTTADLQALSANPAPASAWAQAGLTPPVALDSLQVSIAPGVGGAFDRVLRVHSPQAFSGTLADVLLDVKTATGSQRYQVSLVGPGPAASRGGVAASGGAGSPSGTTAVGRGPSAAAPRRATAHIRVRRGDTMLALAGRHAVSGVSVYQLMLALQRANPQAFIDQNINLVRAGASLAVPSVADMLSISDAEAREQFMAQVAAFDRLRGRAAAGAGPAHQGRASAGAVTHGVARESQASAAQGDRVRLSEGRSDRADARTAQGHALKDAESRVDQLQENVQNLNQALKAQGNAATSAVSNGAQALGHSIQKIAGAISQASHEAAAQAADQTDGASGAPAGAPAAAGTAAATPSSSGAAPAGAATSSASGDSIVNAAGVAVPVNQAKANAAAAERHATEETRHRVNWLQDHLLGVMTALLAFIVFVIAWLLRRANTARDEAETDPRIAELVQEKLQGIDLDLPAKPSAPPATGS